MNRAYALLACTLVPAGAWAVSNNAAANLEVPDPPMNTSGAVSGNVLSNETEFLTPESIRDKLPQPAYVSELPPLETPTEPALIPLSPELASQPPIPQQLMLPEVAAQTQPLPEAAIEPAAGPADQTQIEPSAGLAIEAPETPSPTIIPVTPQYMPNTISVEKPRTTVVTRPDYVPNNVNISKTIVVPASPIRKLTPQLQPESKAAPAPEDTMLGPDGNFYTPTSVDFLDAPVIRQGPETTDAPLAN